MIILGINALILSAQQAEEKVVDPFMPHFTFQVNGGGTEYFGDLNKDNLFNNNLRFGYGAALGYDFSKIFGLRTQFVKGTLFSERESKALKLNTDFWDLSLQLTVNVNNIFVPYNSNRFANFYLIGGGGLTSFEAELSDFSSGDIDTVSGSRQNEVFIPLGVGTSFRLSEKVNLNLEYSDHLTFNDNTLDLFTATKGRDHYSYISAGISIFFGGPRDKDKDKVKDKEDRCPEIPGKIELEGCPDSDNDGIADDRDECPSVAGKAEFKGCPDSDGDGTPDKLDDCPNASGLKELKGCPDQDKDGIADKDDKCPGAAGKKEFGGCPDKDGDGIIDKDDKCPDVAGLTSLSGCPDKDKDGVADQEDKCPDVAGTIANSGCPEEEKILVNEVVYFNTDGAIVIAKYNQLLNKVAETLRDNPGIRVAVEGHTDSRESKMYNMRLSERRADFVMKFFTDRGIDPSRLVKNFFGESKPAVSNETEEGMALNRRVEILSVK
jgi:outer membrane protein OmpA-like peptidoglycan-associated protein/opacity protein-like surface antigen